MANRGRIPPGKLPPDVIIGTRNPMPVEVPDREQVNMEYVAAGMVKLAEQNANIARQIENRSWLVDEYQTETLVVDSQTTLTLQPTYELMPEKIESVIISGPPGNVTLQLGDRVWALVIPASGILVIAPVAILLNRNDSRILTGVAGDYSLELMGIADERFSA